MIHAVLAIVRFSVGLLLEPTRHTGCPRCAERERELARVSQQNDARGELLGILGRAEKRGHS